MKIGIMQPYFFPYLGYWQLIKAVDEYVVYDDVTYIKGGWINRNNILLNGKKHLITIPLEGSSSFKNINEISLTKNLKLKQKILKTLEMCYKKAPYYENIMPIIKNLIMKNENIAMLNYHSIMAINEYLGISTKIHLSSKIKKDETLKGQEKVIHINQILGSDIYYNAIGGRELYDTNSFRKNGLKLCFLEMVVKEYKQYNNEFIPYLSIIDVLMFNSVDNVNQLLDQYNIKEGKGEL
ncbi:WbqC family protein [Schaedlerella arabinosiphila]|uniref:WbqC family protein n=1 Tax=Schaedlerella arabinosiphila TaxID=2044587 RepID=A0A9X5H8B7_9FIRM|nr:WbqC family protein [Schaedlerella arabinosiphila]KAI4444745.1 hypothetical protein C824_000032 [Schaedlerella arabinosiphila]NDO71604.1 WbqC family protein [Schaedlerella arabinosiphila]